MFLFPENKWYYFSTWKWYLNWKPRYFSMYVYIYEILKKKAHDLLLAHSSEKWPSKTVLSPCFHGFLAFLHRHCPPQSPPSHHLDPSLHNQQQALPWACSTIPKLQLPAFAPSRVPVSLSGVCMAAARTVWFSFHLGCHRSDVSLLALNVSPLTQTIAPMWRSDSCFSFPTRQGQVHSY